MQKLIKLQLGGSVASNFLKTTTSVRVFKGLNVSKLAKLATGLASALRSVLSQNRKSIVEKNPKTKEKVRKNEKCLGTKYSPRPLRVKCLAFGKTLSNCVLTATKRLAP